jgi:Dyp-type peroxidase family
MFALKYYKMIEAAQKQGAQPGQAPAKFFDLNVLGADSRLGRLRHWALDRAFRVVFFLLRELWPNPKFGRLIIVTRDEDVRAVLARPDLYEVPFGREMTELAGGEGFVLGLEDEPHRWQRAIIQQIFRRSDLPGLTGDAQYYGEALIAASGGRLDIMKDFFARVASETCCKYFGLRVEDADAFAEWTLSISALLFADPTGKPACRQLALDGAARVRRVIDQALDRAAREKSADASTLLDRLLDIQAADPSLTNGKIRAILVGLATGLVPTTTLAAGRIAQELLRRPDAFQLAVDAAVAGDKDKLTRILFEAARLNPALAPGQWRYVRKAGVIAAGTRRARSAPEDTVILVATASALRDRRAQPGPSQFRLDRDPASFALAFGEGAHECLGKHVAMALITELFALLLKQKNLHRCAGETGGIAWVGPFPRRLDMSFLPVAASAEQCMITISAPLPADVGVAKLTEQIQALGNPARADVKAALDAEGRVHFASLSLLDFGDAAKPAPHLLLELNVDGPRETAIGSLARAAEPWLAPIFAQASPGPAPLADKLTDHTLTLSARPWGAMGLNFSGTGEFSVADIERQTALADFAREALAFYFATHIGLGNRATQALDFVRALIRPDARLINAASKAPDGALARLIARGGKFADFLILPSRRRLQFLDWQAPSKLKAALDLAFRSMDVIWLEAAILVTFVGLSLVTFRALWAAGPAGWPLSIAMAGARAAIAVAAGATATVGLLAIVGLVLFAMLRRREDRDAPDEREPSLTSIRAIAATENPLGFTQNHFTSVSTLKAGRFRRLTFAAALWAIGQLVTRMYRPGFVVNISSIHYARWLRPPDADKLVFLSNFDGSWQSYLEDFITKAHAGQTAVWSNAEGFPRTRALVLDGAQDGDRFKQWVRLQQVPTQFWYARFPELSTDQIRTNAMIHFGLARATDDSAARDWLSFFGSAPRPDSTIETEEIQSLVFRGLRGLTYATLAAVRLPDSMVARRQWLKGMTPGRDRDHAGALAVMPSSLEITFGDHPFRAEAETENTATFVAFSALGLGKLGFPGLQGDGGLATFPSAFSLGMASRSRILGDIGEWPPERWRWSDAAADQGVDAVLLIYAESPEKCADLLDQHLSALGGAAALIHAVPSQPTAKGKGFEPFGFRDGISQPVIRGARSFAKGAPDRDIVEPGEFILGYRNNQGYFPLSPSVDADTDLRDRLATASSSPWTGFPMLASQSLARDFGRNGSFLAIRQLAQDVAGFQAQAERMAQELAGYAGLSDIVGAPISADWVASKMMGRQHDGTPLLDLPRSNKSAPATDRRPDNDFDYGVQDPEGLACPLGSHIRRANPRTGLNPGDPKQQAIVNRHRLLRRGRPYQYSPPEAKDIEQGTLFIAVCADLERQFEFVHQSWVNSSNFQGLKNEVDPIAGATAARDSAARTFTIPTTAGALSLVGAQSFISARAGGYFFLPSRSAIQYLADLSGP